MKKTLVLLANIRVPENLSRFRNISNIPNFPGYIKKKCGIVTVLIRWRKKPIYKRLLDGILPKDMEDMMQMDISILSDYPFSDKQKSRLGQYSHTRLSDCDHTACGRFRHLVNAKEHVIWMIHATGTYCSFQGRYIRAGMRAAVWSVMRNS